MILKKDLCIRDPFILKEKDKYYLYSSYKGPNDKYPSFICYQSDDLEHFEDPVVVFKRPDDFWGTKDFWAPEVHLYRGKYYLFASFKSEDKCRGTQIFEADNPLGPFIPLTKYAITPNDWECLDGTLWIEDNVPYIVFCHEWLQIQNGTICAMRLSDDLKETIGDPITLFKATDAKWVVPFYDQNYITDGPFLFKDKNELCMIWSSYCTHGYAIGLVKSDRLFGKWKHQDTPLYSDDGGHAMLFNDNSEIKIAFHSPNTPNGEERMVIKHIKELGVIL